MGQDVVLGRVQAVQGLVAQPALVELPQHLQLVVRVEGLDTLLLDQDFHWKYKISQENISSVYQDVRPHLHLCFRHRRHPLILEGR